MFTVTISYRLCGFERLIDQAVDEQRSADGVVVPHAGGENTGVRREHLGLEVERRGRVVIFLCIFFSSRICLSIATRPYLFNFTLVSAIFIVVLVKL